MKISHIELTSSVDAANKMSYAANYNQLQRHIYCEMCLLNLSYRAKNEKTIISTGNDIVRMVCNQFKMEQWKTFPFLIHLYSSSASKVRHHDLKSCKKVGEEMKIHANKQLQLVLGGKESEGQPVNRNT